MPSATDSVTRSKAALPRLPAAIIGSLPLNQRVVGSVPTAPTKRGSKNNGLLTKVGAMVPGFWRMAGQWPATPERRLAYDRS